MNEFGQIVMQIASSYETPAELETQILANHIPRCFQQRERARGRRGKKEGKKQEKRNWSKLGPGRDKKRQKQSGFETGRSDDPNESR